MVSEGAPFLELRHVSKEFAVRRLSAGGRPKIHAVTDLTLQVNEGESIGLVGESGCGKTTVARIALLLEPPTSGSVMFEGADVTSARGKLLKRFRSSVQAVFQDPWSSLNPRLTVSDAILEPIVVNLRMDRQSRIRKALELLGLVGLDPAHLRRYPHELSGGQRQRVAIARAISIEPRLIVLDEPVSSLDVSIRSQIMNLLRDLQAIKPITYVTIGHHLPSVAYVSQRIVVMYLGTIVEVLASAELQRARHPYTQALVAATLPVHPRHRGRTLPLGGDLPSADSLPSGCRFRTRCPAAMPVCAETEPPLRRIGGGDVACHLYDDRGLAGATDPKPAESKLTGAGAVGLVVPAS